MLFIVRNHDFLCFQNLCHIFRDEMCVTSVNQILEKKNFLRSIFLGFSFSSVMKYRCWIVNVMFLHIKYLDLNFQVDTILEFSNNQQTKYYALQILESVIKTRWKVLPRNQCEGIKKYIVGLIIKTSSDPALLEKEKTYLNKLNMILVQVIIF